MAWMQRAATRSCSSGSARASRCKSGPTKLGLASSIYPPSSTPTSQCSRSQAEHTPPAAPSRPRLLLSQACDAGAYKREWSSPIALGYPAIPAPSDHPWLPASFPFLSSSVSALAPGRRQLRRHSDSGETPPSQHSKTMAPTRETPPSGSRGGRVKTKSVRRLLDPPSGTPPLPPDVINVDDDLDADEEEGDDEDQQQAQLTGKRKKSCIPTHPVYAHRSFQENMRAGGLCLCNLARNTLSSGEPAIAPGLGLPPSLEEPYEAEAPRGSALQREGRLASRALEMRPFGEAKRSRATPQERIPTSRGTGDGHLEAHHDLQATPARPGKPSPSVAPVVVKFPLHVGRPP
nr:unnamed protein product [Digitaria exilis]